MKKDSAIKIAGIALLAIIALWFLKALLFPTNFGMSISYRMPAYMGNGSEHMYNYGYSSFNSSLAFLLALLIKVLIIVFVIGLFVGLAMLIKNRVFTQEDIDSIKNSFNGKSTVTRKSCTECSQTLNEEWKVCPYCGKEVDKL